MADSAQPPSLGSGRGKGWGMECAYFTKWQSQPGERGLPPLSARAGPCSLPTPQYSQYSHSHDLTAMTKPGRQPAARDPPKSTSPRDHHKSVTARTCCSNNLHPPKCTSTRQRVPLRVYSSQAGPPPLPRRLHQDRQSSTTRHSPAPPPPAKFCSAVPTWKNLPWATYLLLTSP